MPVDLTRKSHTISYNPMWMGRLFDGPLRYRASRIALLVSLVLFSGAAAAVFWLGLPLWAPVVAGAGPGLFAGLYPRWRFYKEAWDEGSV